MNSRNRQNGQMDKWSGQLCCLKLNQLPSNLNTVQTLQRSGLPLPGQWHGSCRQEPTNVLQNLIDGLQKHDFLLANRWHTQSDRPVRTRAHPQAKNSGRKPEEPPLVDIDLGLSGGTVIDEGFIGQHPDKNLIGPVLPSDALVVQIPFAF